jgi:hypothetical protein
MKSSYSAAERETIIQFGPQYSLYGPPYENYKKLDFSPYKFIINRFHAEKKINHQPVALPFETFGSVVSFYCAHGH